MKKFIFGFALMAFMTAGSVNAQCVQQSSNCSDCVPSASCCNTPDCGTLVCDSPDCSNPDCSVVRLGLTAEQKTKLLDLNKKYLADRRALYANSKGIKDDSIRNSIRSKALELRRQHLKSIQSVLTADQYVQFLEMNYLDNPGKKIGTRKVVKSNKREMVNKEGKMNYREVMIEKNTKGK